MARTPTPGIRARILETASRLFAEHGVRAVGMQQVIDEAGVGKSLLYREFPSKDELVAAWLRESDADWWRQARVFLDRHPLEPARQLLDLIEFFSASARTPEFHGCVFYTTSSEFRDIGHPGRREAVEHLRRVRELMRDLGARAGAADPDGLADALMIVTAGLLANAEALGSAGPVLQALPAAEAIIARYCPAALGAAV